MAVNYGVDPYGRPTSSTPGMDSQGGSGQSWDPSQGKWVTSGANTGVAGNAAAVASTRTAGTPTAPVYGNTGTTKDPWGQSPGDPNYGYQPGQGPGNNYGQAAPAGGPAPGGAPAPQGPQAPSYPTYTPQPIQHRDLPVYSAPTITPYSAPDLGSIDAGQRAIIERILAHPETIGDEQMTALNAQAQSDAQQIAAQQTDASRTNAAARGVSDGNAQAARLASITENQGNQVIAGRQQNTLYKLAHDRSDQLGALGAATDFSNATTGRAQSNFSTGLSGTMSQEQLRQAANQSAIQKLLFDNQQDLQNRDENHFAYGTSADGANFRNGQYQFGNQMGFNYAQLNAQQQQQLIQMLLGGS